MGKKITISLDVLCPNHKEHKQCFERLLKRSQEAGFSSLLVDPRFQAAHNREGDFLVYIETTNLFYSTNNINGYVRRCISEGIHPENICAINKEGKYVNITF